MDFFFLGGGGVFSTLQNMSFIWRNHNYWWRASNLYLYSALMAIEQWGSLALPTVTRNFRLLWSSPRTRDSNLSRVFRSNALTTCLNDLCLSRPGFEHQHFACEMKTLTKGAQTSTDIHIYCVTSYIQLRVLAYLIYNQEH